MNMEYYILTGIAIICTIVALLISYYFYIKKLIEEQALDAINNAEDTKLIAAEKLTHAVEAVYSMLPTVVKPFVSKAVIEAVIQCAFDKVEAYAQKQIEKNKVEKSE